MQTKSFFNTYVVGVQSLEIGVLLQCGDRLSAGIDFRRQNLTSTGDIRAVRLKAAPSNIIIMLISFNLTFVLPQSRLYIITL